MNIKLSSYIALPLLIVLLTPDLSAAAYKDPVETDGWGVGLDQRTIKTNWYHYDTGGATTHESFNLLGVKAEYQMPFLKVEQVNLGFNIGSTLFLAGDYTGERGISTYSGDAGGFEVDAALQARLEAGSVNILGRVGGSLTVLSAAAAGNTAASPYNDDFVVTIPEIFAAVGVRFDQFKFMGAGSASLMYRFTLLELGASTDYYIRGDVESTGHTNSGIFFTVNFP